MIRKGLWYAVVLYALLFTFFFMYQHDLTGHVTSEALFDVPNYAPVLSLADVYVTEGELVNLSVDVTDANGDVILVNYSGFMNDSVYRTVPGDAGVHYVLVTASDGIDVVMDNVTITVFEQNCTNTGTIFSLYDLYSPNVPVTFKVGGFRPGTVQVTVLDGNNLVYSDSFDINVTSFNYTMNFSQPGNYSFIAIDSGCSIVTKDITVKEPYHVYGIVTNANGSVVDSVVTARSGHVVLIDDENYSLYLDYGRKYELLFDTDYGIIDGFVFEIVNSGDASEILWLNDEAVGSYSHVVSYATNLTGKMYLNLTYHDDADILVCNDYNFDEQVCLDDFETYGRMQESLLLDVIPGKAFALQPDEYCGDGVCQSYENCNVCSDDCGSCTSGGGGGSGGFAPVTPTLCIENWTCAEWSECNKDGYRSRPCVDTNRCQSDYYKPSLLKPCRSGLNRGGFRVSPDVINIMMQEGHVIRRNLTVYAETGSFEIYGLLPEILSINETYNVSGLRYVTLRFVGSNVGAYSGYVVVNMEGVSQKIPVNVDIVKPPIIEEPMSEENIFVDYEFEGVVNDTMSVSLVLSKDTAGMITVPVALVITNVDGEVVYSERENLAFSDRFTLLKNANVPCGDGLYNVKTVVYAAGKPIPFQSSFYHPCQNESAVITERPLGNGWMWWLLLLFLPLLLLLHKSSVPFYPGTFPKALRGNHIGKYLADNNRAFLRRSDLDSVLIFGDRKSGRTSAAKIFAMLMRHHNGMVAVMDDRGAWYDFGKANNPFEESNEAMTVYDADLDAHEFSVAISSVVKRFNGGGLFIIDVTHARLMRYLNETGGKLKLRNIVNRLNAKHVGVIVVADRYTNIGFKNVVVMRHNEYGTVKNLYGKMHADRIRLLGERQAMLRFSGHNKDKPYYIEFKLI